MDGKLSWVKGADKPQLLDMTIGGALDQAAKQWGEADALVSTEQEVRWSWRELAALAEDMAAGFLALGLERGDRIGIWSPNCAEWTLTQFAAAKIGLSNVHKLNSGSTTSRNSRCCWSGWSVNLWI